MTHLFGIFQQNHHYFSGLPQSRQCKEKEKESVECGTVPVAAFACHHSHWCLLYEFVWVWLFLTHKVIAFIPQFAVSTVSPVFHFRKLKLVFCLFSAACTRYTFLFLALSFWLNSDSKLVSRNQTHQINTIITITTNWTCYCEDGTFDKRKRKKSFANVGCCRHYAWWSNIIFAFCWSWISIFIVSLCLPLYPPIALTFSRGLCCWLAKRCANAGARQILSLWVHFIYSILSLNKFQYSLGLISHATHSTLEIWAAGALCAVVLLRSFIPKYTNLCDNVNWMLCAPFRLSFFQFFFVSAIKSKSS